MSQPVIVNASVLAGTSLLWHTELLRGALCRYVASGPLVRSSYRAGEFFIEAMIQADAAQRATGA